MPEIDLRSIPVAEAVSLSKAFLNACQAFYAVPSNRKKFEEWQASRKAAEANSRVSC